jgi:uncharacterized protein
MQKHLRIFIGFVVTFLTGCTAIQRPFLFYPTHHDGSSGLSEWKVEGKVIGYAREVRDPRNVWLMLHGNGGQAADRVYAMEAFSDRDSVFIMEYPGYGSRLGKPSKASFDAAATEAYQVLRRTFPRTPICVVGESIGSGPACSLATELHPPDKIMLVVPFDRLTSVAGDHVRFLPVSLMMEAKWDNIRSLSAFRGPVEIFGASQDTVIPIEHARKLADAIPSASFQSIPAGHNDWWKENQVRIRNP